MYGLGRQAGKAAIAKGEGAPGARRNEELTQLGIGRCVQDIRKLIERFVD
jgi:hypothetical protein